MSRRPQFESGLILEPDLLFGGQHKHPDPKIGLWLYGPYTEQGQPEPIPKSINVGIVGSPSLVANAKQFFDQMRTKLTNDGTEPFQHPPFPGFNDRPPFICELYVSKAGCEVIKDENFEEILKEVKFRGRIKKVVELYAQCVKKYHSENLHRM